MALPTARDILVAKGLAKPGRGRFSAEANAFLATLTEGVDYAAAAKPAARKPATSTESAPVREARARAASLPTETKATPKDIARAARPEAPVVRSQTVAWGLYQDGKANPPVLAISSCAKCKQGIRRCACEAPMLPAYAGGGFASLTKPTV